MKDYYKILGVKITDTDITIKKSFKKLAKKYHPDLNPNNPQAEAHFKEINEAYNALSTAEKRNEYDNARMKKQNKKVDKSSVPMGSISFEDMMKGFDGYVGEEHVEQTNNQNAKKVNLFDSEELFKNFMGFK